MAALVARESVRAFAVNRNFEAAATLAYYGFLSLMPLLLLVLFVVGWVAQSSDAALTGLQAVIADLLPTFQAGLLAELGQLARGKVWGLVGAVVLVWSMTPFASAARSAVVRIFKADRRASFLRDKLGDLAAVLALLVLFVALVGARLYFGRAGVVEAAWWTGAARAGAAWLVTVAVLGFFYFAFAPVRLTWRDGLPAAVVAALLLSVMRPVFALVLAYNPSYGYAFGSVKAIFLLIVWVYYTFAVVLFGAEVAANAHRREALVLRGVLQERPQGRLAGRLLDRFVRSLDRDAVLFREGEAGHEMFAVLAGAVRLTREGREICTMRAGAYFGEMSMLLRAPRTATAVAAEDGTQLVAITEENFDTILRESPATVRRILQEMARRLAQTNERLAG